jgi:hypothetical protein
MVVSTFGDVRQQRQFTRPLHGTRYLALMAPARSGNPPRADLSALGDKAPQRRDVLVVDLVDVVAAVRARLTAAGGRPTLPIAPANRSSTLLCHLVLLLVCTATPRVVTGGAWQGRSRMTRVQPNRARLDAERAAGGSEGVAQPHRGLRTPQGAVQGPLECGRICGGEHLASPSCFVSRSRLRTEYRRQRRQQPERSRSRRCRSGRRSQSRGRCWRSRSRYRFRRRRDR